MYRMSLIFNVSYKIQFQNLYSQDVIYCMWLLGKYGKALQVPGWKTFSKEQQSNN